MVPSSVLFSVDSFLGWGVGGGQEFKIVDPTESFFLGSKLFGLGWEQYIIFYVLLLLLFVVCWYYPPCDIDGILLAARATQYCLLLLLLVVVSVCVFVCVTHFMYAIEYSICLGASSSV
jgi:hypothetical protein